jgi:hypothetical protein
MVCRKHHNSLRYLLKTAVEIPLEMERVVIASGCSVSRLALRHKAAILSDTIINENPKTIANKLFVLKSGCFV